MMNLQTTNCSPCLPVTARALPELHQVVLDPTPPGWRVAGSAALILLGVVALIHLSHGW